MGVPGLTTYIYDHSDEFFQDFQLRDTKLVIDGHSLSSMLYSSLSRSCCFGGDYDAYHRIVKDFFVRLKRCNVEAFVVFDGGLEARKLQTLIKRANDRLILWRNFQRKTTWKLVFFPLFKDQVFMDVLLELEIKFVNCWFEADQEIASLASFLGCPVFSRDSDFFIFGCLYIPIDKTNFKKLVIDLPTQSFYMESKIYDPINLATKFRGDRRLLPYIPVLCGNDYANPAIFHNFFNHLSIPSSRDGFKQSRLRAVINWLRNETYETVEASILRHVKKANAGSALSSMRLVTNGYELSRPRTLGQLGLGGDDGGDPGFEAGSPLANLPEHVVERYKRCDIPACVIDMITLGMYYPGLQVEDVSRGSSHLAALPIIAGIDFVAKALGGRRATLKLIFSERGKIATVPLPTSTDAFSGFDGRCLVTAAHEVKANFIYQVLSVTGGEVARVEQFGGEWRVYALALVFWLKACRDDINPSHVSAIFLMTLCNIFQDHTGVHKNHSSFMKWKAMRLRQLRKEPPVLKEGAPLFPDMLDSVGEVEYLRFTERFIKFRSVADDIADRGYFMTTLHVFAMFQSVLYHVMRLNQLLASPFPRTRVHRIYSGTLAYNLYFHLHKREDVVAHVRSLLETEPNILSVYNFLVFTFGGLVPECAKRENRTRPGASGKRRSPGGRKRR